MLANQYNKQGKYSVAHSQYDRHGVTTKSYTGFYMFLVAVVTVGGWAASVILSH